VMPSSCAFSRIHRFCSSVRVNDRGAVFSGVFVCSRMSPPKESNNILSSGLPLRPSRDRQEIRVAAAPPPHDRESTVEGGASPPRLLASPAATKRRWGGAGSPRRDEPKESDSTMPGLWTNDAETDRFEHVSVLWGLFEGGLRCLKRFC
jgi:hypothetical protein